VKNHLKLLAGLAVAVAILAVLTSAVGCNGKEQPAASKPRIAGIVRVVKPEPGGLERRCVQPATVESWEVVRLFSEVSGILSEQKVDINSEVKEGQVLARIYAPDLVKERDLATASLIEAQKKVALAEKRKKAAECNLNATIQTVKRLEVQVKSTKADFAFHDKRLKRYATLAKKRAIAYELMDEFQDRYEKALSQDEDTQAALDNARENKKVREGQLAEAIADVKVADLNVEVASAALAKAQVFVDFTEILAPFDGVVTLRGFNNGAFIRAKGQGGTVPLLTVNRTDKFRVVVYVPDVDVPFIHVGDPVELKIFSLGMTFPGKVDRLALSEQRTSRLMRAEVDMYNDIKKGDKKGVGKGLLQDGMFGEIAIHISNVAKLNANVVNIPSVCLQGQSEDHGHERKVYVVRPGNQIDLVTVTMSYNDGKNAEIVAGLTPADRVVLEYRGLIHKGSTVRVVED
jgi:RND family efflux transporter MFP subunit